jgi:phage head maturation protease
VTGDGEGSVTGAEWPVKAFRPELKSINEVQGTASAIISRFGLVDADQDLTLPGAFRDGVKVPVSHYGHQSWSGALPVGLATVHADEQVATASIEFFLHTQAGRDHFEVIKALGELGEWSFGYEPASFRHETVDGQQVRILEAIELFEISPVLKGAGVRTTTVPGSPKRDPLTAELAGIRAGVELAGIRAGVELAGIGAGVELAGIRDGLRAVA